MRRNTKLLTFLIVLLLSLTTSVVAKADNGVPYKTYTEDSYRRFVPTQDAYIPMSLISDLNGFQMNAPEDIFIDNNQVMYIADTGNSRVIVVDEISDLTYEIGNNDILKTPTGVFADDDGFIYVADKGKNLVYKFDRDGNVVTEYGRPNSPLFGKDAPYRPLKVSVDARGNVYVIGEGSTNGVIQFSNHGDFLGYFGSNYTNVTLRMVLQQMFFTEEQKEKILKMGPPAPVNIAIDQEGLINTISGQPGKAIKKLNISGGNLLPENMNDSATFVDLFVGPIGNIYAIDASGYIYEYDMEGNLLFAFAGNDKTTFKKGLFRLPSAIVVDKSFNIYVLDKDSSNIQVFVPTQFANLVHEAIYYYQEGYYIESQGPWEEVLKLNSMFDLAHKGLGQAHYQKEEYREALDHFEIANYKQGYSDSYWEIRNEWLMDNLTIFFVIIAILLVIRMIWKIAKFPNYLTEGKKAISTYLKEIKLYREISFSRYFMKHPSDGCYGIKREHKISMLAATLLYFILYIEHIVSLYYSGFYFTNVPLYQISLVKEFAGIMIPLMIFVISNYLVSSIREGEGRFKDVYKGTILALTPMIIFWPIIIFISNFLTQNEAFIVNMGMNIIQGWSIILIFVMIKELHNYSLWGTIKNIFITIVTMIILVASIYIVYILLNQVYSFVYEFILEVIYRVQGY